MKPLPGPLWQPLATEASYRAGTDLAGDRSVENLHRYGPVCFTGCRVQYVFCVSSLGWALRKSHGHSVSTHRSQTPHCVTSGNLNYCSSVSPHKTLPSCLLCRPLQTNPLPKRLESHLRASPRTPASQGSSLSPILSAPDSCLRDICKGGSLGDHQKPEVVHPPTGKDRTAPINFAGSSSISAWISQFAPNLSALKWV